jgi:hypothetical protein
MRRDSFIGSVLGAAVLLQGIGVALLARLTSGEAVQVLVVSAALGLLTLQAWRVRMRLNHRIDMLLVMGALGGLGMLAGWWVDLGFQAPPAQASFHAAMGHPSHAGMKPGMTPAGGQIDPHADHGMQMADPPAAGSATHPDGHAVAPEHHGMTASAAPAAGPFAMVFTWMTGLMLAFAIPAGVVLTRCARLARTGWRRWVSTHLMGNVMMVAGMIIVGHRLGPALGAFTGSNVLGADLAMLLGMLIGMEAGMFLGESALGLAPWREWRWREDWDATLAAAARRGPV